MKNLILFVLLLSAQFSSAHPADCKYAYSPDRNKWSVNMGEDTESVWHNTPVGAVDSMSNRAGTHCKAYRPEDHICSFEKGIVYLDGSQFSPQGEEIEKGEEFTALPILKKICKPK